MVCFSNLYPHHTVLARCDLQPSGAYSYWAFLLLFFWKIIHPDIGHGCRLRMLIIFPLIYIGRKFADLLLISENIYRISYKNFSSTLQGCKHYKNLQPCNLPLAKKFYLTFSACSSLWRQQNQPFREQTAAEVFRILYITTWHKGFSIFARKSLFRIRIDFSFRLI